VGQKSGKLLAMEAAEQERRDMLREAKLQTPMQQAAKKRREGALERIRAAPPQDPRVGEAGIERAREAIRMATASGREA
jgi:hypothetical protein